jgi:transposase
MVNIFIKTYHSDISDKDWKKVDPHIPKTKTKKGRKRLQPLREILNGIFYILRSGCQWRMIPPRLPAVEHSLSLFPPLAYRRNLGCNKYCFAD